ncbi:MAG TPA: rod shape-determining protein RodA [Nitrospirae bacterium]|nr:rod shape-determining protein RodA [Nitrospirota bacterium]
MSQGEYLKRGFWRNFDTTLLVITILLCAFGVVSIYSANLQSESPFLHGLYIRQIYWIGISLMVMGAVTLIDYRFIERMAYPLYFAGVITLVSVNYSGRIIGGSQRWISMYGFNLQPSELMKIIVIIFVARIFDDMRKEGNLGARDLIKPLILVSIPFLIVAKQPDLGTAVIYMILFASIAFFNGISRKLLLKAAGALALLAPAFWFLLKPYQKERILGILNPEADPMGHGYHIIQSKIAIGSGGMWGKGIFEGTQSKLNFLPAKHTDFIFSVFSEEVGFVGSMVLIAIFFLFIMRFIEVILHANDKFGSLVVVGIMSMIAFNFFYNIGMTLGLFPIVGIPLPFISYGGSSLLTNFIGVGLALNVSLGRYRVE